MVQTLYALLAIMIVTTFSLSQRSVMFRNQYAAIVNDLDMMGTGIATEQLDFIASKPFDSNYPAANFSALTPPSGFGLGSADYASSLDIDDFHNKSLALKVPAYDDSISFTVDVQVQYVDKVGSAFTPHSSQTGFKEIQVTVNGENMSTVTMSRVLAYH